MKRRLFLLSAVLAIILTAACSPEKNEHTEHVTIDSANIDEYLTDLPEYDKITVKIDKSKFTEELTDDYIERYYERLAKGVEGLTDEEGNLLPLSDETVALLNIPAFSDLNEFKVFVRGVVEGFIDKENDDKKINAALEIMRNEASFAEIPEDYLAGIRERIVSEYEGIAAEYDISANDYLRLSDIPLEEEVLKGAKNELIYIKLAKRLGLEYADRDKMIEGVREYLLGIIKVSKK